MLRTRGNKRHLRPTHAIAILNDNTPPALRRHACSLEPVFHHAYHGEKFGASLLIDLFLNLPLSTDNDPVPQKLGHMPSKVVPDFFFSIQSNSNTLIPVLGSPKDS
jgi:hypothetical protein